MVKKTNPGAVFRHKQCQDNLLNSQRPVAYELSYSFGFSFSDSVSPKILKHSTVKANARPG